jgi:hypothetical protein
LLDKLESGDGIEAWLPVGDPPRLHDYLAGQ